MPTIFISYRRDDTAPYAAWLYDRLSARFGKESVFIDIHTIAPGEDFARRVEDRIASCDVLVAMIGRDWLTVADGDGRRRLDDPHDYVRLEIAAALDRNVRVVPLLVDGVSMPRPEALPKGLEALAQRQALAVTSRDFDQQIRQLIRAMEGKRRFAGRRAAVAGVALLTAVLVPSLTIDRPLPLSRWVTGRRLVVVMDSRLLVYGEGTQAPGRTTYDDLYDALHDLPGFKLDVRQEATYPSWRRENHLQQLDPDLLIIHASCFYAETEPSDYQKKLVSFLRDMERTRTKFLVYSRDPAAEAPLAPLARSSGFQGRLFFLEVEGGPTASFADPRTARQLKAKVTEILASRPATSLRTLPQAGQIPVAADAVRR